MSFPIVPSAQAGGRCVAPIAGTAGFRMVWHRRLHRPRRQSLHRQLLLSLIPRLRQILQAYPTNPHPAFLHLMGRRVSLSTPIGRPDLVRAIHRLPNWRAKSRRRRACPKTAASLPMNRHSARAAIRQR